MLIGDTQVAWEDFTILRNESNKLILELTLFFLMFVLDPPENIKIYFSDVFMGDQKGTLGRKRLKESFLH